MITNINEFKNSLMENSSEEFTVNLIYKIYDRTKGGSIMYSQAKYLGQDDKGYKFQLINKSENNIIHLDNINNYTVVQTRDFTTKPPKK